MLNALSVDLEDWYHPQLLKDKVAPDKRSSLIRESCAPLLGLLDRHRVKATFFILGETAQNDPELVRLIHSQGHEIASHGMSHQPLWEIGREGFRKELEEFEQVMQEILGKDFRARGFRAPSFSLDNSTRWALEVLAEKKYLYDSSIFPVKNKLYGLAGAPLGIYYPSTADLKKQGPAGGILEFPMAACMVFGIRVPVSGGFYFRAIPLFLLKMFLKKINRRRPFVFYLHPWETCPRTPRIKGLSATDRFITYWGINGFLKKLERLLDDFDFAPINQVLGL